MDPDVLAPYVASASVAMVLTYLFQNIYMLNIILKSSSEI